MEPSCKNLLTGANGKMMLVSYVWKSQGANALANKLTECKTKIHVKLAFHSYDQGQVRGQRNKSCKRVHHFC